MLRPGKQDPLVLAAQLKSWPRDRWEQVLSQLEEDRMAQWRRGGGHNQAESLDQVIEFFG